MKNLSTLSKSIIMVLSIAGVSTAAIAVGQSTTTRTEVSEAVAAAQSKISLEQAIVIAKKTIKGDVVSAANDINKVRARANANPVAPLDVDIDYILDERLRELLMEEFRTATLNRLGRSYDRMSRLNEYNGDQIREHHNKWPIPYSEIERNTGAVIEQNPGYL